MQSTTAKQPHYYVGNVAPALFQRSGLSPAAKIVATCLLMHKNRTTGLCYVTQMLLAIECEVSRLTVTRALAELRDRGLISWEARKAPRGRAKGRANSYDLSGLEALCSKPIMAAETVSSMTVSPMIHRDVSPVIPHASDFRAITDNSLLTVDSTIASQPGLLMKGRLGSVAVSVDGKTEPRETGDVSPVIPHSPRIAQAGPLKGLSVGAIHERRLAPNSESAFEACVEAEAWDEATHTIKAAGGEEFNPDGLSKLCEEYGNERVWFQAKWFARRLASLVKPPDKPTAYFVQCVRNDYPVNPSWPEYCRWIHGRMSEAELADVPAEDASALELVRWMYRHDWRVVDFPTGVQARLNYAAMHDEDVLDEILAHTGESDLVPF